MCSSPRNILFSFWQGLAAKIDNTSKQNYVEDAKEATSFSLASSFGICTSKDNKLFYLIDRKLLRRVNGIATQLINLL